MSRGSTKTIAPILVSGFGGVGAGFGAWIFFCFYAMDTQLMGAAQMRFCAPIFLVLGAVLGAAIGAYRSSRG